MLKRLSIVTIPLALVLVWYFHTGTNVAALKDEKPLSATVPPSRLQPQILSPRKAPENDSVTAISEICRTSFGQLFDTDFAKTIRSTGKEGGLLVALDSASHCDLPKQMPLILKEHLRRLKDVCHDVDTATVNQTDWLDKMHPCLLQSLVYRSLLNSHLQKDLPIRDITDVKLLTDKLVASIAEQSPYQTIEALDRLEQLVPGIKEIDRARASAYLSIAQEEARKEGQVSPELREKLSESVQLAKENSISLGNDDDLIQIDLYSSYLLDRNSSRLLDRALEMREKYPESGVPEQFLAIANFKKGNKEKSIEHLRRYQTLTGDPRASHTIARIQRGEKAPFDIELKQSVELLQLDLETPDAGINAE